jgi:hypothetical protein
MHHDALLLVRMPYTFQTLPVNSIPPHHTCAERVMLHVIHRAIKLVPCLRQVRWMQRSSVYGLKCQETVALTAANEMWWEVVVHLQKRTLQFVPPSKLRANYTLHEALKMDNPQFVHSDSWHVHNHAKEEVLLEMAVINLSSITLSILSCRALFYVRIQNCFRCLEES